MTPEWEELLDEVYEAIEDRFEPREFFSRDDAWNWLRTELRRLRAQAPEPQAEAKPIQTVPELLKTLSDAGFGLKLAEAQQPSAEPKLADHAFVECPGESCTLLFLSRECHKPGCGRPRSEHPEGR